MDLVIYNNLEIVEDQGLEFKQTGSSLQKMVRIEIVESDRCIFK